MHAVDTKSSVKIVGTNGQITLGKEFAGRQVLVEEREPGVWLVRTALVIPENELWLHQPAANQDFRQALAFAQAHPASASDLDALIESVEDGETA